MASADVLASDVGLYRFSRTGNPIRAIRSDIGNRLASLSTASTRSD